MPVKKEVRKHTIALKYPKFGGDTKKEAEVLMRLAMFEFYNSGILFEAKSITFNDYLNYWYDNFIMVNHKYSTQQCSYRQIIDNHVKPVLGIYRISDLKATALQNVLNSVKAKGYSKNYISNI